MNLLSDIITYVRRIIKSPSNAVITDNLIIDYINRFWIMDVDARMQLFDLKTKWQFQTTPGIDQYNMPLYTVQSETPGSITSPDISYYPVYQGLLGPAYINGIQIPFDTQKNNFYNIWPNVLQYGQVLATGNNTAGPYNLQFTISPINTQPINPPIQYLLRGHVDLKGVIENANSTGNYQDPIFGRTINIGNGTNNPGISTTSILPMVYFTTSDAYGNNNIICDSGQFLLDAMNNRQSSYGLLMSPGNAPYGNTPLSGGYSTTQNTINYLSGLAQNVYFPEVVPPGVEITGQCYFFQCGLPRAALYYNNTLTLRSPPDTQYFVEVDAYLSPSAFFNQSQSIPFAYMSEYIARGAARKILSDTGDLEQFAFYEPLFKEQELLVWKRSQRQWTSTRTQTIYSQGINQGQSGFNNIGGSTI
jgi:hypothetical protein